MVVAQSLQIARLNTRNLESLRYGDRSLMKGEKEMDEETITVTLPNSVWGLGANLEL